MGFYEDLSADYRGKGFASMWKQNGDKKLQLAVYKDIGRYAAEAFARLENYPGKAIFLAGDELTFYDATKVSRKAMGRSMPESPRLVGPMLKKFVPELGTILEWMATSGFGVDVASLRQQDPLLMSFEAGLLRGSQFRKP